MGKIFTPSNQVKLTNVAVVRLKKCGHRFEIACYKNKVMEYRSGIEKDLSNVLQCETVFTNVSKGQQCPLDILEETFKMENALIIKEILLKGELQVSDRERDHTNMNLFLDVATIISETTINSVTGLPYTLTMVEKLMKESHVNVTGKPPKILAKKVISILQNLNVPIKIRNVPT